MTIAFLVLANTAPRVLSETIKKFSTEDVQFFVHVDKKSDRDAYMNMVGPSTCTAEYIEDRHPIYWGGYNMIKATESLARAALRRNEADCFVLLSDDSFPLFSSSKTVRELNKRPDRIDHYSTTPGGQTHSRYNGFYFMDSLATSARWLPAENREVLPTDLDNVVRLEALRESGKYKIADIRTGSQWWSLSKTTLMRCLDILQENSHLRTSFEFSAIPDETLFQTLAYGLVTANGGQPPQVSPMFADFSRDPKPFIFRSVAEDLVVPTNKLFIRKISNSDAIEAMQTIEARNGYE